MLSSDVVLIPRARLCQSIIQPEFINTPMTLRQIFILPLGMPFAKYQRLIIESSAIWQDSKSPFLMYCECGVPRAPPTV